MLLIDQLTWSFRHSKRQFFESLLVVLAIGLGVAVIVTVLTLFLSVNQEYKQIQEQDYFRTFEVLSSEDRMSYGDQAPLVLLGEERQREAFSFTISEMEELQAHLPDNMYAFAENMYGVKSPLLPEEEESEEQSLRSRFMGGRNDFFLTATTANYFQFKNMSLQSGSWFVQDDVDKGNPVVVLSHKLAERLYGDEDPVGKTLPIDLGEGWEQIEYTVIGVLGLPEDTDYYTAFSQIERGYIPLRSSPYELSGRGYRSQLGSISVGVDPGTDLVTAYERIKTEVQLKWGEKLAVRSPFQELQEMRKTMTRYALLIGSLASVGLIIAVVNILNLMLARVLKRTKSVGLSMALGSSRALVFRQFLMEAIVLGVMGAVLGIVLSFGLASLLQNRLNMTLMDEMVGEQILLGVGIGLIVSLLFGVYPAYQGARIDPVDALRTD